MGMGLCAFARLRPSRSSRRHSGLNHPLSGACQAGPARTILLSGTAWRFIVVRLKSLYSTLCHRSLSSAKQKACTGSPVSACGRRTGQGKGRRKFGLRGRGCEAESLRRSRQGARLIVRRRCRSPSLSAHKSIRRCRHFKFHLR